jgi:hypothetical protein
MIVRCPECSAECEAGHLVCDAYHWTCPVCWWQSDAVHAGVGEDVPPSFDTFDDSDYRTERHEKGKGEWLKGYDG